MKRTVFIALVVGFSVTLAASAQDDAGQTIHRCVGSHGEIVFSGLPCGTAAPPAGGGAAAAEPEAPAAATACPTSADELRDRIAAAIARHDSNAIAGLLRWRGISGATANARLRALRELTKRPLLAIEGSSSADVPPESDADGLLVRTGSNVDSGIAEHAFTVRASEGCYWLEW